MLSHLLLAIGLSACVGAGSVAPQRALTPTNTITEIAHAQNYVVYADTFFGASSYEYNDNYLMQVYVTDGQSNVNPFEYRYGFLGPQHDDLNTYRWFMFCYSPDSSYAPLINIDNNILSYNFPVNTEYIYGLIRTDQDGHFSGFDFYYTPRFQNYAYTVFASIEMYSGKYDISLPAVPDGRQYAMYHLDLDMVNDFPNGTSEFHNTWDFTIVGVNKNTDSAIYQTGVTGGYNNGYTNGYDNGFLDGSNAGVTFFSLFGAIADTPLLMLRSLFNFDLFGANLLVVILSLVTGLMVFYVVRKFI